MISKKPILYNFMPVLPQFKLEQGATFEWLKAVHSYTGRDGERSSLDLSGGQAGVSRILKLISRLGRAHDRIRFRWSYLEDLTHTVWDQMRVYNLNQSQFGAGSTERTKVYSEVVNDVLERLYREEDTPPSSLVHVTCTGYVCPSAAQRLVAMKNWGQETEVLHAYHMGCYASLPAVRIAVGALLRRQESFSASHPESLSRVLSRRRRVDVFHSEFCSLHLDPSDHSLEQLTIQSLFSDGAIRYSLNLRDSLDQPRSESHEDFHAEHGPALELIQLQEEILPNSATEMTWTTGTYGMNMGLSRTVPDLLANALPRFLDQLAERSHLSRKELTKTALFAIHPGGPQVIDKIKKIFELTSAQTAASNEILEQFGNMSSVTLPSIWNRILQTPSVESGTLIVSLAFGPGLTLSGALMRKIQ